MSSRRPLDEEHSTIGRLAERVIEAGWLMALAAVPLYFDVYSSRVFEPDKTTLLRCLVLIMLFAQALVLSERPASPRPDSFDAASQSRRSNFRRWLASNPLLLPVVVLVAVETAATATSITPAISFFGSYQRLQGTYTFLTYVALFFLIVANLRSSEQVRRIVLVAILTSLPIAIYGIVQHLQLDPLPWGGDVVFRVTSTMGNAIFLAAYLIMVIPITAARLVSALNRLKDRSLTWEIPAGPTVVAWTAVIVADLGLLAILLFGSSVFPGIWWASPALIGLLTLVVSTQAPAAPSRAVVQVEAIALSALVAVQVFCVLLTQSRGPWLGLLAGTVVLVVLLELRHRAARRLLLGTVCLFVVVAGLLVVFNLPSSPLASLRSLPYVGRLGQLGDVNDGTGRVRVLIWQGTFDLLRHLPAIGFAPDPLGAGRLVIGYGPEAMHSAYNAVYPPALGDLESRNASPDRNHNDLLDHLVMTGGLGLAAYLALVVAALRLGWRGFRRSETLGPAALLAGLVAALTAHLVETQTGIAIVSTLTYFWTILAILVVATRHPEILGLTTARRAPRLAPVAGGAPSATRPKKSAKRASVAFAAPPAPVFGQSVARGAVIVVYTVFVVIGVTGLTTLATAGLIGAQAMMYGAFALLAVGLLGIAVCFEGVGPRIAARSRTFWVGILGFVVVAIAIGLNLNQLAADVYHKQGSGFDAQQRYADSAHSYAQALSLSPSQDYYALFLGRAYLELATHSSDTSNASTIQPSMTQLVTLSPAAIARMSRLDTLQSAEVALFLARDLDPLDPDHYANLARLYRLWGETSDRTKLDLASHFLSLATTLSPHSAQLFNEWAITFVAQGKLPEALDRAKTAVELDPEYSATHLILGDVYLEQNAVGPALTEHRRALELDPTALSDGSFEHRVALYVANGKGQVLADEYAQLIKRNHNRSVLLSYAYILSSIGQVRQAIEQYRAVASAYPTDWLTQRNLAVAYAQAGDIASARNAAEQALRNAPADQQQTLQKMIASLSK